VGTPFTLATQLSAYRPSEHKESEKSGMLAVNGKSVYFFVENIYIISRYSGWHFQMDLKKTWLLQTVRNRLQIRLSDVAPTVALRGRPVVPPADEDVERPPILVFPLDLRFYDLIS
jgi:hypothetical protein